MLEDDVAIPVVKLLEAEAFLAREEDLKGAAMVAAMVHNSPREAEHHIDPRELYGDGDVPQAEADEQSDEEMQAFLQQSWGSDGVKFIAKE